MKNKSFSSSDVFSTISKRRLWDCFFITGSHSMLNYVVELFTLSQLDWYFYFSSIYKNKQSNEKEYPFRKHFIPSSALPAQPGCTVCRRHSAFLDDKKHIPFHHNRPYLLKQSVQACRKNLPQNGTCSTCSIALKFFVWMYVLMVIWVRGGNYGMFGFCRIFVRTTKSLENVTENLF